MMMKPWLARALRRLAGNTIVVLAALAAYYETLHARPELPPASVDRVRVSKMEGEHTITDPAKVRRIVAILRSDGEWTRYPDPICLPGTPRMAFYQGAEHRGTIVWGPRAIGVQSPGSFSSRGLSPADAAELHRLLEPE
jgi:hypothetical protein